MLENTDIIVAYAGLILVVLTLVFVFTKNIILEVKKNAKVRAQRIENQRYTAKVTADLTVMFDMLEKY